MKHWKTLKIDCRTFADQEQHAMMQAVCSPRYLPKPVIKPDHGRLLLNLCPLRSTHISADCTKWALKKFVLLNFSFKRHIQFSRCSQNLSPMPPRCSDSFTPFSRCLCPFIRVNRTHGSAPRPQSREVGMRRRLSHFADSILYNSSLQVDLPKLDYRWLSTANMKMFFWPCIIV